MTAFVPAKLKPYLGTILTLAVFAGSLAFLVSGILVEKGHDRPDFFIDEAHKLGEAYFGHLFFGRRDFGNHAWTEDFYARTNPPVSKYIFWAALAAAGHTVRDLHLQEEFERNWKQVPVLREQVPDGMLRTTRYVSAFFGALASALLFLAAYSLGGPVVGLLASVLFIAHPDVAHYGRVGLPDTILLFFMVLMVPVTMRAAAVLRRRLRGAGEGTGPRGWGRSLLVTGVVPGLVAALAVGTKLTGAVAAAAYAVVMAAAAWGAGAGAHPRGRRLGHALAAVALAGVVSAAFFIVINPSYYRNPGGRALETMRLYRDWTVKQQVEPGGGLLSLREKAAVVGIFMLRSAAPPLSGLLGAPGAWLTVLGFVLGIFFLARRAKPLFSTGGGPPFHAPDGDREAVAAAVALIWAAACIVGTTLWLPLTWSRYLLIPYMAACLVTAVGLASLPQAALALWAVFKPEEAAPSSRKDPHGKDRQKKREAHKPAVPRPQRGPVVAALIIVAGAWAVLALTPWVIQPELVPPSASGVSGSPREREWYLIALTRSPDRSAPVLHNVAQVLAQAGQYKHALPLLEKALALTSEDAGEPVARTVRTSRILFDLARLRAALGDRAGVLDALRRHRDAVRTLRDAMISADPKIREEYDQIIADDDRMIGGLT